MPRDRVGHLWVLHAKSVPRNGLRERRDLERDADKPRSLVPRRAIDPFKQDETSRATACESAGRRSMTDQLWLGTLRLQLDLTPEAITPAPTLHLRASAP